MACYTTEQTLYFYETRRGLEPAETEQNAHLALTLSTQEEYDRETGQVEQTQVQVDYAWSAGRPHWRGDDAITVTWDPGQDTYAGSFVSEHRADGAQYDQIGRPGEAYQGRVAWSAPLDKAGLFAKELEGTARFVLLPKTPRVHSQTEQSIFVHYQHSVSSTPLLLGAAVVLGIAVWWGRRYLKKSKV